MSAAVLLLAGMLSLEAGTSVPAPSGGLEIGADLLMARTIGDRPLFDYAACLGGSALVRFRSRWAVGLMLAYQKILDPDPAVSFWYGDLGARRAVLLPFRFSAHMDLGWSIRHIDVSGYSNTVGGPMGGAGLGWAALRTRGWIFRITATYHVTTRAPNEPFATQYLGLGASVAWLKWR